MVPVQASTAKELYARYKAKMQQITDVRSSAAMLQWDQETYLPKQGAATRSRQLATLSEIAHNLFTASEFGKLLNDLATAEGLEDTERKNVSLTLYEYNRQTKLNAEFVKHHSEAVSAAFYAWLDARKQNNFGVFRPAFENLLKLKLQEAELRGYEHHPYDALLQEYEKSTTVARLDGLFESIKRPLRELIGQAQQKPWPQQDFLQQHFPREQQWKWGMYLVEQLGFDMNAGRQDISEHPFSISFSPGDVRITTRIDEHDFLNMTWSCIHEAGHAMYEQGIPIEHYGVPAGEYASLSIHESQSRIWENCIGRSKPFWSYYLPKLKEYFPVQLADVDLSTFAQAINKVQPSLIRTEADELTYHFHVIIRYELEKMLLDKTISAADVPSTWATLYRDYLGVEVPDDLNGALQDVHWSHGSFGYFPTYSLGSMYAAQFYHKAQQDNPGLQQQLADGNTTEFLNWLRNNIHQHGKLYDSDELCARITGEPLNTSYFTRYYHNKLQELFR